MAVNVERNRWVRNPEDFAVDLRQRDISGLFKKSIFIEEGTIGLHLIQGRYDKRLEPGEHILEGAIDTAILGGRDRHNIVLIHTGGVTVNITLPRLLTVDPIPFGVQTAVSLQFASGREAAQAVAQALVQAAASARAASDDAQREAAAGQARNAADRLARQAEPAFERGERQGYLRIFGRAHGVVPQPDIPAARRSACIAAFDCERRPVDRVERDQPAAAPPEGEDRVRVVAIGRIGVERMVEPVLALPDQSCKLALVVEFAGHAQRVGRGGDDARHHRAREIDGPEARIETLEEIGLLSG